MLALVRLGLRAPDDPRIVDTLKLIDATLRRETTTGPAWKRSTDDGYGETADGQPFDKSGIGRGWPLLAGERGHYELAAGRREAALDLLKTMARQTSACGMIPEQVWDAPDIPARQLYNGHPSGSGMPLAWAHAEFIKLLRSLHLGHVWDRVPQCEQRYQQQRRSASFQIWTPTQRRGWLIRGKDLRLDLFAPSVITWKAGRDEHKHETTDTGLGIHTVTLPTRELPAGACLRITTRLLHPGKDDHSQKKTDSFTVRVRS
jgi:glucoamylase